MRKASVLAFVLCCWCDRVSAQGMLQTACRGSDAVVVGAVAPAEISDGSSLLNLTVDKVIKGDLSAGGIVTVRWPGSAIAVTVTPENYRGVWFLKKTGQGWAVDPVGGPRAPLFASGLAVPRQTVQAERAQQGERGCEEAVWTALRGSAELVDEGLSYQTAIETLLREAPLFTATVPGAASDVQEWERSPKASLRGMALAVRIRQGNIGALVSASEQIEELARGSGINELWSAVASWCDPDPRATAAMGKFAANPVSEQAAAQSLMMIHSRESVPHLARLLNSRSRETQLQAVRGLSLFLKGVPSLTPERVRQMAYLADGQGLTTKYPAMGPYITVTTIPAGHEQEYIEAWKWWWETAKTDL